MSQKSSDGSFFISGTQERLFLNLELGCNSSCSYCYLPIENIPIGIRPQLSISPEELFNLLIKDTRFISGKSGTILSIGCFSECFDKKNKKNTINFIKKILKFKNWVQVATKRQVFHNDLVEIISSEHWDSQLVVYISSATIAEWTAFESGTTKPNIRFKSFDACNALGVRSFLYIKPVITDVTIRDIENYSNLLEKFSIDAIVGDVFSASVLNTGERSPISENLVVTKPQDIDIIRLHLSRFGRVFSNSTDPLLEKKL